MVQGDEITWELIFTLAKIAAKHILIAETILHAKHASRVFAPIGAADVKSRMMIQRPAYCAVLR